MIATLRFQSLGHAASSGSLTHREWESLARALGELEAEGVRIAASLPERAADAIYELARSISNGVEEKLSKSGLNPREWLVYATPKVCQDLWIVARQQTWSDLVWQVEVQLLPDVTDAKKLAADTRHAPTLSEQYGKAKKS